MPVPRSPRERLLDIQSAISKITGYLAGKQPSAFHSDPMLHDAVIHNLAVISEASRHLPDEMKSREADISWRNVADMGNWLRHGYDVLDDEILWDTVARDLPVLKASIDRLLLIP